MKIETAVIVVKGGCVAGAAALLTLSSSLGQWANTDASPSTVEWVMIICGCLGTGMGALGGFLSSSFGNYLKNRNGIDIVQQQTNQNEPSK